MTREQYESLPLAELKEIAKARGMKGTSARRRKKRKPQEARSIMDVQSAQNAESGRSVPSPGRNTRKEQSAVWRNAASARSGSSRRRPRIWPVWTADRL